MSDLAVVLELEMLRLGTVDADKVPFYDPICVRCYIRRAAPECHSADHVVDRSGWLELRRPLDGHGTRQPMLLVSADPFHALAFQNNATCATEGHPAPLRSSPLQDAVSSQPTRFNHTWWWRHAGNVCWSRLCYSSRWHSAWP
jgi:hypothetical protein